MRARSIFGSSTLLLIGCAGATPPVASPSGSAGTPVSARLHWELTSVAEELSYEDPCPQWVAAQNTGYDECLTSFDCTYCRMRGGWWMLQGCQQSPAQQAAVTKPVCAARARCGIEPDAS